LSSFRWLNVVKSAKQVLTSGVSWNKSIAITSTWLTVYNQL